jgi:hypothetical protein
VIIGGLVVLGVGDPTQTDEYQALEAQLADAQSQVSASEGEAQEAAAAARQAQGEADQRQAELDQEAARSKAELDQREQAVAAREQAVTAVEETIAANSIGEGTWTVGRDIAPGTYRTSAAVTGQCYWGIYRSGTNGSDIVDNDIVTGGFPTVRLSDGQDFTNNGCGTFVKE